MIPVMTKRFWAALISGAMVFTGCQKTPAPTEFSMGQKVPVGQVTYQVVESDWKAQLGEGFKVRSPENRFLLLSLSVTNGTGKDISIPLLTLAGSNGQTYDEVSNGEGVVNWFGLLRTISPGQTQQGAVLFDVPLTSYKLRVPDVADPGFEKFVTVQIPLRLDSEVPLPSPISPDGVK
jgi:hypothetical protein